MSPHRPERDPSDERLRDLLRAGDPAAGAGLSQEEIARMRRAVLGAPAPARSPWVPRLAWAGGLAALLVAAGTAVLLPPEEAIDEPVVAGGTRPETETAAAPDTDMAEEAGPAGEAAPVERAVDSTLPGAQHPEARPPVVMAAASPEPADAAESAAREARHVQFTAPGGTRIIWTLDPEFKL